MAPADLAPARRAAFLLIAVAAAALPRAAIAQPATASVEAEALYQRGHALLKAGKTAEACDAFDASLRVEASTGTLLNLARCREESGQLATAWALFLRAASSAQNEGARARAAEARRRAQSLEPRLSQLTLSVPEASRISGLEVTRDGQPIDPLLWNQGVPLDGGVYVIEAKAPGNEAWSTRVTVPAEGGRVSVEVPRFKSLSELASGEPPAAAPASDEPRAAARPAAAARAAAPTPGRWTTLRFAAAGSAVVGVAAIAAGAWFGAAASDAAERANALCPTGACSDPEGLRLADESRSKALTANVSFAVGGAAVVGAAVLWFLGAPDDPDDRRTLALVPVMSASASGLAVRGRF